MIDYYSIDETNFAENNLEDENKTELIKCLINRLIFSNIRLVSDANNSTLKSLRDNLKCIKSLSSQTSIKKKLQFLVLHNKIRKSKFQNIDTLDNALKKFSFYSGQFVFHKEHSLDNKNLLIERNNDHIYEDLKLQEEGVIFNKLQNDDPLIKAMLGSTFIHFGVFNFIDSIYSNGSSSEDKIDYRKKVLSESLEFFLKIFSLAQSDENNFFYDNKDQKKLIIYCSTRSKVFDSKFKAKIHSEMLNFYNKDLIHRKHINSFVENGGKIKICIFSNLNYDDDESEDREDLHERFIKTQNGIFSISKDLDVFKINKRNELTRRPIKFGYHTDFHSFAQKAKINNFQTQPFEINLEN